MKVANNPTTMHKYKNSLVLNGWLMNTKTRASLKVYELLISSIWEKKLKDISIKLIIKVTPKTERSALKKMYL